MVLRLKARESRSLPGQKSQFVMICDNVIFSEIEAKVRATDINAGWSSPVARQAHNLKVAGSNPAPATNSYTIYLVGRVHSAILILPNCILIHRVNRSR